MSATPVPENHPTGRLVLVPTPIGNREDITERAQKVLQTADFIAAEDTRYSLPLLAKYGCTAPIIPYHEQGNYQHRIERLLRELECGKTVAVITSAGTPGISDPGFAIVRAAIEQGIAVECLPGATALIPALVVSGLPSHRFVFEGFLPPKGRKTRLLEIAGESRTTIIYEAPQRLVKLLEELRTVCGDTRRACVVRELSKVFEEVQRGTLSELLMKFSTRNVKGEIVVIVEGKEKRRAGKEE